MADRFALEQSLRVLVDDHTLRAVTHALVEIAYARARICDTHADYDAAASWRYLARLLTDVEATAVTRLL